MNLNSFSSLFVAIALVLIFSLCVFIPSLSQYGYISSYYPTDYSNSIDISSSILTWPTPRLYYYYFSFWS